jgi:hypothetical protein
LETVRPLPNMKKVIKIDKMTYIIPSIFCVFFYLMLSVAYFVRGQGGMEILSLLALHVLFMLQLACIRIEIDENFIKYISIWKHKQMGVWDVLYATTECGMHSYSDRFKMDGLIRLIIVGKSKSKLVINMKLFPKKEMIWLLSFAKSVGQANGKGVQ